MDMLPSSAQKNNIMSSEVKRGNKKNESAHNVFEVTTAKDKSEISYGAGAQSQFSMNQVQK